MFESSLYEASNNPTVQRAPSVRVILLLSSKLFLTLDQTPHDQWRWKSFVSIIILSLRAEELSSIRWFQMKYTLDSYLLRRVLLKSTI